MLADAAAVRKIPRILAYPTTPTASITISIRLHAAAAYRYNSRP